MEISRWARYVLRDPVLAEQVRQIESRPLGIADVEALRAELLDATAARYRLVRG